MKIFITGGTGFIGSRLAEKLITENHDIVLLLRDPAKAVYFKNKRVTYSEGHLLDKDSLIRGMKNCDWVFHLAAFTRPWSEDPSMFYRTNVTGTINIFEAALECRVKKVVFTSTAGTMSYSHDGKIVDELTNLNPVYHTLYESTKAEAEKIAVTYCQKGLHVVIVNPTRVYGPGNLTISNSVTRMIKLYGIGFWRIIPGDGKALGNYVFIEDIVNGHILAAMNGKSGERYILGGENLSYNEFFRILAEVYDLKRNLINLNKPCLKQIIRIAGLYSKITGKPIGITNEWIERYLENWIVSSNKAQRVLNYQITSFKEGAEKTVLWLRSKNKHYGK